MFVVMYLDVSANDTNLPDTAICTMVVYSERSANVLMNLTHSIRLARLPRMVTVSSTVGLLNCVKPTALYLKRHCRHNSKSIYF